MYMCVYVCVCECICNLCALISFEAGFIYRLCTLHVQDSNKHVNIQRQCVCDSSLWADGRSSNLSDTILTLYLAICVTRCLR